MALIRLERVNADKVLEAQEFQTGAPECEAEGDGTLLLHFRSDEGHPSLTVMIDGHGPEGEALRQALAA
jgi:hypothetical protein